MKHIVKNIATCIFALSLFLMFADVSSALTLQESYYLQTLYPKLPKNEASYPARLNVKFSISKMGVILKGPSQTVLKGTCGMNASINEDEMISILKQALSSVSSYKELENAVNDKNTVSSLTEKLKFTDEDIEEVLKNLRELVGLGDIPGLFNPISAPDIEALNGDLFHDYELINGAFEFGEQTGDIIDILAGQGDIVDFIKPDLLPSIQDLLYNGAKISWQEFLKDQQKWKDIATMYQAKQRLRQYYARVDELVRDFMSKNGNWTIRINDQQVVDSLYNFEVNAFAPYIWTADIELVKNDNSYGNINGVYQGRFNVKMDAELSSYDSNYHNLWAAAENKILDETGGAALGRPYWKAKSQAANQPSQELVVLDSEAYAVTLSLPAGVNRTIFELPVDVMTLNQKETVMVEDMQSSIEAADTNPMGYTVTHIRTIISDSRIGFWDKTLEFIQIHNLTGETYSSESPDEEDILGGLLEFRPYFEMTLVVDML